MLDAWMKELLHLVPSQQFSPHHSSFKTLSFKGTTTTRNQPLILGGFRRAC